MALEQVGQRHSLDALRAVGLRIGPIEWELVYLVQPSNPIGRIRQRRDVFHAKFGAELVGV